MTEQDDFTQWATPEQIAEENPAFTISNLNYLSRIDNRDRLGFSSCLRFVTPRKRLIHRQRFHAWVDRQNKEQEAAQ